jgi:hypothetical protein
MNIGPTNQRRALTRIEVVVIVGVVALLMAALIPAVNLAKRKAYTIHYTLGWAGRSQGSAGRASLGFETESRWDSGRWTVVGTGER